MITSTCRIPRLVFAITLAVIVIVPWMESATAQTPPESNPDEAIPGLVQGVALDDVTIYGGASDADKQATILTAQTLLADAIFANFARLDTRLSLIMDGNTAGDALAQALGDLPLVYGYDDLTAQVVLTGNADEIGVQRFIAQLIEADYAAMTVLDPAYAPVRDVAVQMMQTQSQLAFAEGLLVLVSLSNANPGTWDDQLATYTHLYAGETVSLASGISRLNQLEDERTRLIGERGDQFAAALDSAGDLTEDERAALTIQPDDTPEMVITKAITLRDHGYIIDALAAYDTYAAMFAVEDPGAELYARTAQQFTLQMAALDVQGGAYLVSVNEDSVALDAGLAEGDIVIAFDGAPITNADDLFAELEGRMLGDPVEIVYLHLDTSDVLRVQQTTVEGAEKLGIWYILI